MKSIKFVKILKEKIPKIKPEIFLLLILVFALFLRLYFFNGLHGHDDWVYLFYVRSLYHGLTSEVFNSLWGLRLVVIFPMLFLFKIFQPSFVLAFLPTFLFSMGSVVLAYLIPLGVYKNYRVALLSALFASFYPLDAFIGTTIRGDVELLFFSGLSFYFFVKSYNLKNSTQNNIHQKYPKLSKKPAIFLILSGISAYLAYMSKDIGILIIFSYFAIFCYDSISKKKIQFKYLFIIVGVLMLFSLECFFYRAVTGNWLQRYEQGSMWYTKMYERGDYKNDPTTNYMFIPCFLFNIQSEYCNKVTGSDNFTNSYFVEGSYHLSGFFFYPTIFFSVVLLLKKEKNSYIFIIWLVSILLFIAFGSMSLQYYAPFHKEPRYFTIVSLPVMIILARGFDFVLKPLKSRERERKSKKIRRKLLYYFSISFIAFLLLSSFVILYRAHNEYIQRNKHAEEVYDFFKYKTEANVYADTMIAQELNLRSHYTHPEPVHNFLGENGYGFIEDLAFLKCDDSKPYYIVVTEKFKWEVYENLKPCINLGEMKPVKVFMDSQTDEGETRVYYLV